jgi:hypothetical protein
MSHRTLLLAFVAASSANADHFDDHILSSLQSIATRGDGKPTSSFTLTELAGLPKVVQGSPQSVLLVVKTDEGNWSKLLVRSGGVKRKGSPQPKPFLHVERLVTFSADARRGIMADKKDVFLFPGFALDLDLGQVVSKGDGDDLSFDSLAGADKSAAPKGEMMEPGSTRLGPLQGTAKPSAGATLFIPRTPLVAPAKSSGRTKATGTVSAADYPGKYKLDVDGRFTGVLELKNDGGKLSGGFTSEQSGAVFQVTGSVGTPAQQMTLSIAFPRTDLKLDGRLFTRGRSKIAGLATMEENVFGFVAERID